MGSWGVRMIGRCGCGGVADGYVDLIMPTREAAETIAAITWKHLIADEDGGGVVEMRIERIRDDDVPPEEGGRWAHPTESYRWPVTHREVRRCPPTPIATCVGDIAIYCVPGGWAFGGDDDAAAEMFSSWDEAAHAAKRRIIHLFYDPPLLNPTRIRKVGGSLDIRLTRELRWSGLGEGDEVEVFFRPSRRIG